MTVSFFYNLHVFVSLLLVKSLVNMSHLKKKTSNNSRENLRPGEWKSRGPLRSFHRVNLKYLSVKPQLMVVHISPCEAAALCLCHHVSVEDKEAPTLPPTGGFMSVPEEVQLPPFTENSYTALSVFV